MGYGSATIRLALVTLLGLPLVAHGELYVAKNTSGELGYDYRRSHYANGFSGVDNMLTGRINSDGYIWQPWFVTMGISLAVTQDRASSNNGIESNNHFTSGELNMGLLPLSRFPFTLRYMSSDTRLDSSGVYDNPLLSASLAHQFRRNNLLLTQGYYGDLYRLNLRYNTDEATSDLGESYLQRGYGFDYALRGLKQNLTLNGLRQKQTNNQNNSESENDVLSLNHNYYPDSSTTLDTSASHVKANNFYTTLLSGVTQQVTTTIDQASTTLGWRSSSSPLRIFSGVRVHSMEYAMNQVSGGNVVQSDGMNASLGSSYQFTERLSASANGQYGALRSELGEVRSHSEGATVTYASERQELRDFDYGWNSSLTGSNQQSGTGKAQSVMVNLGHNASRTWQMEGRNSIRLTLGQELAEGYFHSSGPQMATLYAGVNGEARRLAHSLSLGWMANSGEGSSMAQLTLSDSRGVLGDKSSSTMANLQLSRSQVLNSRSMLNGSFTWQAWHNTVPGMPDHGVGTLTSGSGSYRYARPFTLQRVSFVSELRVSDNRPALGPKVHDVYWSNRFVHEIGMLRSSLGVDYRDHLGVGGTLLMFSTKRLF